MSRYVDIDALGIGPANADGWNAVIKMLDNCLKDIPVADVSPVRHGRWEQTGYACGETEFQCSECKQTEWRTSISRFNFCPFCGAKMDAEG